MSPGERPPPGGREPVQAKIRRLLVEWRGRAWRFEEPGKLDRWVEGGVTLLLVAWCMARFAGLETSPPGYHGDESYGSLHVACLGELRQSAEGNSWPMFANGFAGGFYTPVYLYSALVWTKVFGLSIASLRGMIEAYNLLAIAGLWFLARHLLDSRGARLVAFAAALSPWAFHYRVFVDPPIAPAFLVWGVYFLLRWPRILGACVAGVLLSLGAYTYPPTRIHVALLVPLLLLVLRKRLTCGRGAAFLGSLFVANLPLLKMMMSSDFLGRSSFLAIFSPDYVERGRGALEPWQFILYRLGMNMLRYLSPDFLFSKGDPNLRHSTHTIGELGYVDQFAILIAVVGLGGALLLRAQPLWLGKREFRAGRVAVVSVAATLFGFVPAALTWEGQPHMIRSMSAWPAISLFTGTCLWMAWKRSRVVPALALGLAVLQTATWGVDYFVRYPKQAFGVFTGPLRRAAETGDLKEFAREAGGYDEWEVRYHLIRSFGQTCSSSRRLYRELESYRR